MHTHFTRKLLPLLHVMMLCLLLPLQAQVKFPVTVSGFQIRPSLFLDDYTLAGTRNMSAAVLLNDMNETDGRVVFLRFGIESNSVKIQPRAGYLPQETFTIYPGEVVSMNDYDFFPWFNNNIWALQGISRKDLDDGLRLPDGFYQFSVEVCDARSGKAISNKAIFTARIEQYAPPVIFYPSPKPLRQSDILIRPESQNIVFQWQMNSPEVNFSNTDYRLEVYEVPPFEKNPRASVENHTARQIFQSDPVSSLSYVYTQSDYPLDVGVRYAFRVIANDKQGRNVFRNQGISETAFFYYGYPEGGTVPLISPVDSGAFSYRLSKVLEWGAADNLIDDQPVRYDLRMAPLADNEQPSEAILQPAWLKHTTAEAVNKYGNAHTITQPLGNSARYVWQVTAYSGSQKVAESKVRTITGPPVIPYFYAGTHQVTILKTVNTDLEHLSGEGEVKIHENGQVHKVVFRDIEVSNTSGTPVLRSGKIINKLVDFAHIDLPPTTGENGKSVFVPDSFRLTRDGLYLKGVIEWNYPFAVDSEQKPVVRTHPHWYNFNSFKISGTGNVNSKSDFKLLDPFNFRMKLEESSEIRLYEGRYTFLLNGFVETPTLVKGSKEARYSLHFKELKQLFYNEINDYQHPNQLHLIPRYTELYLAPRTWTLDLSDTQSCGKMSSQPEWKGVYMNLFEVHYTPKFDGLRQIQMARHTVTSRRTDEDSTVCMIDSRGLQMNYHTGFEKSDTAFFNTFPASLSNLRLDIKNSIVRDGHLKGGIYIPVIDQEKVFPWTVSITPAGFQSGCLDEDLTDHRFAYNQEGGEQLMWVTIRRAVFEQRERINMDVDIEWPHIGVTFTGLQYFRTWGNYNIGFVEPGGTIPLTTQKQGNVNGFEVNIENLGCGRQGNLYAIGVSAFMVMGEDVTGPEGPARSNFYSISQNTLLSGTWAVSGTRYDNKLQQQDHTSDITGGALGERPEGDAEAAAFHAQLNTYYDAVEDTYGQIEQVLSSQDTTLLAYEQVSDPNAVEWRITPPDDMPPMLDINNLEAPSIKELLMIIDMLSMLLNEDQQATYRQLKESVLIAQQQADELTSLIQQLLDIKKIAITAIYARYDKEKGRLLAPVSGQMAKVKTSVHSGLQKATDQTMVLVDKLIDPGLDGIRKVVLPTAEKSPPELNAVSLVNKAIETTRKELKEGIRASVETSIEVNIVAQVDYLCDSVVTGTLNRMLDIAIRQQIDKVIAGEFSEISLEGVGNGMSDLLNERLNDVTVIFSPENLTATLSNTAKDAALGIRWEEIGVKIMEGMLGDSFANYTDKKAEEAYNKLVEDVLGKETIAGQLVAAVPINFNNIADNLVNGRIDKIIAFAPVSITVKTKVADFTGYVNFMKGHPEWGDVWMATLEAMIKISPNFSANATYINGTADGYKYWFLDIGVRNLGIPVGATGLAFDGAAGRVYHHMSRPPEVAFEFNNKVDVTKIPYRPDSNNKFGVGLTAYFYDKAGKGDMILFDCGLEVAFFDNGFTMTMNGNILVANKIENGRATSSLIDGTGYLHFSSVEKSFIGRFGATINAAGIVCVSGEMGVSFSPGKWEVYLGKRETPLQVSLLCAKNPQLAGWFQINQDFVDLGVAINLKLDLTSPWIGVSVFKARAWARFMFAFGADAKVSWKPIRVNRAHIYAELYAGVGIDYKAFLLKGSFTVASLHLGGDLLFISEPFDVPATETTPAITKESSISGKLYGKVVVLGCGFGFNMGMKYNI